MGLDVYLYRYVGDRTRDEDLKELEAHYDAFENISSQARIEIAGEPVKVMEDHPLLGVHETSKDLTTEEYAELKRVRRLRQSQYIEQNNLHLQMGEWGPEIAEEKIEIDSEKYPEHMFKIGYMRSSYNSGGFNSVVREIVGHDLYWLFAVKDVNEYIVRPDWKVAATRCQMLIDQLAMDPGYIVVRLNLAHGEKAMENFGKGSIDERESLKKFMSIQEDIVCDADTEPFIFDGFQMWPKGKTLLAVVNTEEGPVILLKDEKNKPFAFNPKTGSAARAALKIFKKKMKEYSTRQAKNPAFDTSSFSCKEGDFFLNGIEVRGFCFSQGFCGKCIDFIRHDQDNSQWYYEAAIIVQEMIAWVLAQPNPNEYYFHWSG